MQGLLFCCTKFNRPLNAWVVSNVTDMTSLFCDCYKLEQATENWYISADTRTDYMFDGCEMLFKVD